MDRWFAGAAALSLLTTATHILGGGVAIHAPMLQADWADDVRATWSVVWHGVSIFLATGSTILAAAAMGKPWGRGGVGVIALMYAAFAALFIFYGLSRLGNLYVMPQWTIFVVMLGLIVVAMRKNPANGSVT